MPNWLEISLPSQPDAIEQLSAQLVAFGFDSFQIEDSRDFSEYSPHWDMADEALIARYRSVCRIIVYLPDSPESLPKTELLRTLCPTLTMASTEEKDWAENWKQYYKPFSIGAKLLIQPAWLPLDNPEHRAVFWNNPGMSFGTGLHASTRLCLELLEKTDLTDKKVLDIGCGSGILSLCALLLGAKTAVGIDIDPLAADISRENAQKNGLADRFSSFAGNFIEDTALRNQISGGYDCIFSNIVADVIIALAPLVGTHLRPGGRWIVSGIISHRLPDVLSVAEGYGFSVRTQRSEEGWEGLELTDNK